MARKFSTGLRNAILGLVPSLTSTGISGTAASKTIADTGKGLGIFQPGDKILVPTALVAAGLATVATVAQDGSSLTVSETVLDQVAGASYPIALLNARAFTQIFANCLIEFYAGSQQPSDADQAETGVRAVRITNNAGSFTPGSPTNGLNFGTPTDDGLTPSSSSSVGINPGETWSGLGLVNAPTGGLWFRCYSNLYQTGASKTAIRFDGVVTLPGGGGQLEASSISVAVGVPITVSGFTMAIGV